MPQPMHLQRLSTEGPWWSKHGKQITTQPHHCRPLVNQTNNESTCLPRPHGRTVVTRHQHLKHAAASTLKIGCDFLKKYRTKISIPSLSGHLSEMASTLVVKWCICD